MSNVTLKVANLREFTELAEKYPAIAEKHVNRAIARSLVRILGEEKSQAPFGVTGNLRDNWTTTFGRFTGSLRSNAPYSMAVHEGTAPHYVSPAQIKRWAEARGLNPFAVAKSIARKGTRANPFLRRSVDAVQSSVDGEFAQGLDGLVAELAKTV
jgi:hypothetical protein